VDLDPLAMNIARKRSESYREITLAVADGFDLPFAEKRFDYVLCSKTVHHFTDERVLQMIMEVHGSRGGDISSSTYGGAGSPTF